MFFSLNKKFFLSLLIVFLLSAGAFIIIFDNVIGTKIRAEHKNIISRNQYVIEILNENIMLRKKINQLQAKSDEYQNSTERLAEKQEELSRERNLNEESNKNYNENYATLAESLKIISFGAALTLFSLIIFWFLLRRWVLSPIDKLISLSAKVANGNFTTRLENPQRKYTDEFDTLAETVNFMLSNIEKNITDIKEKEVFLQSLIDALPDAVRIIDENYNIVLSNKTYQDYIRKKYFYPSCTCYGAYDDKTNLPCNNSQYICPLQKLKHSSAPNLKIVHNVNECPLSINSAPIYLNGKFCIVESIRDLSENVIYSHQQKISSLGFLAASLAHEMKNNLGAINLILDGLLQKYFSDTDANSEEKRYLEMISAQIKECINVPERLLKLSRNTEQTSQAFNITTNINDILSLLDYEIKRKGITLLKSFSNINETLNGNETDFKMIILNLVQNAINAMPNGGTLEIKTNTAKNIIRVEIKDSGCGIPENKLKRIFEPYYSTFAAENTQGTGLGLAIVKNLILKFDGKINVTSKENIGSCFQISFPRQQKQKMLVK